MEAYSNYFSNTYDTSLQSVLWDGAKLAHQHNKQKEEAPLVQAVLIKWRQAFVLILGVSL